MRKHGDPREMKAIVFERHGSVENLHLAVLPDPEPEPGMAIVRVRAVALNGFDPMILKGIPGLTTPLPMIPGGDVAGEVVSLDGQAPFGVRAGARVLVDPAIPKIGSRKGGVLGETVRGGACELLSVPVQNLIPVPDNVTFEDAASLPIAYGTAYRMMIRRAQVAAKDKVLILGASGGVGTCCLQLAKLAGAEVAVCTSARDKGELLRQIGADHVIDTSAEDFVAASHRIWGKPKVFGDGGGADIVINYNGGDSWAQSLRTVRRGGKLLTCGATNGYDPQTDIRFIWSLELNILGSNMWEQADLTELLRLVAERRIAPVKSSVRPLEELPRSLQELIDRRIVGKAVLSVGG
jgi:alcohol dehydrogenase